MTMAKFRLWANYYEPARARATAATLFQVLLVAGVVLGDWPEKVDAILALVGVLSTLVTGQAIRDKVFSPATVAGVSNRPL